MCLRFSSLYRVLNGTVIFRLVIVDSKLNLTNKLKKQQQQKIPKTPTHQHKIEDEIKQRKSLKIRAFFGRVLYFLPEFLHEFPQARGPIHDVYETECKTVATSLHYV